MFILPACENLELELRHFYFMPVIAGRREMGFMGKGCNLFSEL